MSEKDRAEDEEQSLIYNWTREPWTRTLSEKSEKLMRQAFAQLKTSCEVSTDPQVRAAYTAWAAAKSIDLAFKTGRIE